MTDGERVSGQAELIEALTEENQLLRRQLDRQRRIRHRAEEIAERGLSDLYQRQRELEFLSTITSMANEAGSVDEVLASVLEYMCHFIGWPAAHAYLVSADGDEHQMTPSNIWYVDLELELSEFRSATAQHCFQKGAGLPGRIWATAESTWLDDLTNTTNFPRRDSALRSGLRTAFSVPLLVGSEVMATVEFFGPNPIPKDVALLELIAEAGTQLGRVMERDRARLLVQEIMSELSMALDDSRRANALVRANTDALLDPQVLFGGVRDASGRIVDLVYRDVNMATCQYLGLGRDELIGHSCLETLPNIEGSGLLAHYIRCAETGEAVILDDFPYYNELLDDMRYYDVRGASAGSGSVSLTWRDVTDRVVAAQRVSESERRFRLLAENMGDVVVHVREGRVAWISPSVEEVLGAGPDHWLGRDVGDIVPPDDRTAHLARLKRIDEDGQLLTPARVLAVDGTVHWIHTHARTFFDAEGNPDGFTASFRVIDDEVNAMEQAEEARHQRTAADARYRKLLDNAAVGMCITEAGGRFEEINPALCNFFGYDAATLKKMSWQQLTAPDYLEADLINVEDIVAGRIDSYRFTKQFIHADGHLIWGDLAVSCLRKPNGDLDRLIAQVTDITMEVEARQYLARRDEQNRILTQRLQAKTDQLQTELTSAASYVSSILPGELDGPVRVSQRYLPSRELGGDCFDYRWIDDDHLVVYLIDVSGHGIAPALLSISVHNMLRSGSLTNETLLEPDQVLAELNRNFQMDRHGGHYFTVWYGVYEASTRTLRFTSAGHPPALVFGGDGADTTRLASQTIPMGMFGDTEFTSETCQVPAGSQILLYSDGAFELPLPDGGLWTLSGFVDLCSELARSPGLTLGDLTGRLEAMSAAGLFNDDCSLVLLNFD